jgi:predicted nucleic acid-binding Zn ribbon protein
VRPSRRRPPQRVGELLPGIASRLGLEEELRGARAISSWRLVVEEHAPAATGATRLVEVRPPTLVVAADDAATAQELRLHSAVLLEAFAQAPGGERLRELTVVVRPPHRGPSGQPR